MGETHAETQAAARTLFALRGMARPTPLSRRLEELFHKIAGQRVDIIRHAARPRSTAALQTIVANAFLRPVRHPGDVRAAIARLGAMPGPAAALLRRALVRVLR